jgi:branched-chain amino acid aminotransferase
MEKVFLNDNLVDLDKACISVADGGFLYGAGLFETMRCSNGVVFCLDDHLDRLFSSAEKLLIVHHYEKKYIAEVIYKLLDANGLSDARLRLTLTAGSMTESQKSPRATLLIAATQFQPYPPEYYQKGILITLSPFRQNVTDPTCGHKTTSYFLRMLALKLAHQKMAAEALWFTTSNLLAEGSISNVFLVKDSALYTPPLSTPVLPGIARKTICKLAADNSVQLVETELSIDDLLCAQEVFLTNVIMKIMPITSIEKHTVGDGKVGPLTKKLQGLFDSFVEENCKHRK